MFILDKGIAFEILILGFLVIPVDLLIPGNAF